MNEMALNNLEIAVKEEIMDENDLTNGVINVKQEEEMLIPDDEMKAIWNSLRDNFRKYLLTNETEGGPSAKKIKTCKHTDQSNFYKRGNTEYEKESPGIEATSEDYGEEIETFSGNVQSPPPSVNIENRTVRTIRKRKVTGQTAAMKLMRYLISEKENEASSSASKEEDPIDAFLSAIAPVLKSLPPHVWHSAKSELFTIAQKFEAAALNNQQACKKTT